MYPFGGLPRHIVPRNDILRKRRFIDTFTVHNPFIAFTTNNVSLTILSLLQIKYALDHEGWAVGEGCCGGITQSADVENGSMSATLVIIAQSLRRKEPFRGIATALRFLAMTYWENHYKQFISITPAEVSKREVCKPIANH